MFLCVLLGKNTGLNEEALSLSNSSLKLLCDPKEVTSLLLEKLQA